MQTPAPSAFREMLNLLRPYWLPLTIATLLGILGGAAITALLATINYGLHTEGGMPAALLLGFAGLCVLALLGSIVSDRGTNYVGQHVIANLRKDLGSKIIAAPIEQI